MVGGGGRPPLARGAGTNGAGANGGGGGGVSLLAKVLDGSKKWKRRAGTA